MFQSYSDYVSTAEGETDTTDNAHLGGDEEIFTLDEAILDSPGNTLTGLLLISIVARAVQEAVATLDRIVDGLDRGRAASISLTYDFIVLSNLHQRKSTW